MCPRTLLSAGGMPVARLLLVGHTAHACADVIALVGWTMRPGRNGVVRRERQAGIIREYHNPCHDIRRGCVALLWRSMSHAPWGAISLAGQGGFGPVGPCWPGGSKPVHVGLCWGRKASGGRGKVFRRIDPARAVFWPMFWLLVCWFCSVPGLLRSCGRDGLRPSMCGAVCPLPVAC